VPRHLLDTQIVEYGWRYRIGSEHSSTATLTDRRQARLADDLLALDTLFGLAQRYGSLAFRVAPQSMRELADSLETDAAEVMTWAREVVAYDAPDGWPDDASSRRQAPLFEDSTSPRSRASSRPRPPPGGSEALAELVELASDWRVLVSRQGEEKLAIGEFLIRVERASGCEK
jgi:hypothetical protein